MILGKKKKMPDTKAKSPDDTPPRSGTIEGGVTTWANKGNNLVESSMYAEAIRCYNKALEINPRSLEVLNNRGLALARTGRLGDAILSYDRALDLKPDDPEVLYNKGIALAQIGKTSEALACYDKLIEANPNDFNSWCSKGDVLFEAGNYEEALKAYDQSIQLNPTDETAWNNRGMTLVKFNRYEEAIESYDKALELNPGIEKIWSNKGLAIAKMNEKGDKIDLAKIAVTLPKEETSVPWKEPPPKEPSVRTDMFENPLIRSIMEKSSPVFEKAEAFAPEMVSRPVPDSPQAIIPDAPPKEYHEPVSGKPAVASKVKSPDENMVKGNLLYSQGKYEEAIECFTKLLEKDDKNKTAWNNKGLALGKFGRVFEAIDCYDKALEIAPGDPVVLNNKGSAFFKKGRVSEALECYKTALEKNPDSKTAIKGIELCNEYFVKSGKKAGAATS
ncbi:MAG: tetratricopeptide repeat protein [Euryarchaeota archaeon]|nr:tetratricopeptide repeat protein [Euryarchaeota archaeon]MBU4139537.1 tetratricopeptide repeat protein [Euryarchaeota archaeon]